MLQSAYRNSDQGSRNDAPANRLYIYRTVNLSQRLQKLQLYRNIGERKIERRHDRNVQLFMDTKRSRCTSPSTESVPQHQNKLQSHLDSGKRCNTVQVVSKMEFADY